jgi:hypothetical protein
MENKDIRKLNLAILIKENKNAAVLAKKCNTSEVYLRQIMNGVTDINGMARGVGNVVARKLEEGCGKPIGWLDTLHDEEGGELMYIKNPLLIQLLRAAEKAPPEVIAEATRGIDTTTQLIKNASEPKKSQQ